MIKIFRQREQNIQIYVEVVALRLNTWFATTTTAIVLLGEASSTRRTTRFTMGNYFDQEYAPVGIGIVSTRNI